MSYYFESRNTIGDNINKSSFLNSINELKSAVKEYVQCERLSVVLWQTNGMNIRPIR